MSKVWQWESRELQAFVEEHWPFLVATLNDPVVRRLPTHAHARLYTTAHAHVWYTPFFVFSHQHSTIPPTMQAQVRLRCCHTITSLLAINLPITRDHDRVSQLVEEGFLVLLSSSELSRNSPARSPTTAEEDDATPALVFVEALALLRQLAKNETQLTEAAVQRAIVGFLPCIAHIPVRYCN
jgi:hypothetical protein